MKNLLTLGLFALALPIQAQDSGAYLALRQAFYNSDDERVAEYLDIELKRDPDNVILLEEAILSSVYHLDLDQAVKYADRLDATDTKSMAVEASRFAKFIHDGDFQSAYEYLQTAPNLKFVSPEIIEAWAIQERDGTDDAIRYLEDIAAAQGELSFIYDYQRAMMEAYANRDYSKALEILENGGEPLYMSDLSFYSHIALLKLSESANFDIFMRENYGEREAWPGFVAKLVNELEDGNIDDSLSFASPQNAVGNYLSALLGASQDGSIDYGVERLLNGLAPAIAPDNSWFILQYMRYFEQRGENQDVIHFADLVSKNSFLFQPAEQGKINALFALEQTTEIRDWVEDFGSDAPDEIAFQADTYRRLEDYEKAAELYEESLAITGQDDESYLWVVYGLAISYERLGEWNKAETTFLQALELAPDNPDILNYLGYSYVDRGEKLDTGLEMIEKAVEISPSQGHIIDSLGWAYYRLGRYDEALEPLERATILLPQDAIVNSHLGDLYWQLGRKREAQFQWERSLRFLEEDTIDLTREQLEDRLENGLSE